MATLLSNEQSFKLNEDIAPQQQPFYLAFGVADGEVERLQNKPHDMAALSSNGHSSQLNQDYDRPMPLYSLSCITGNKSHPEQVDIALQDVQMPAKVKPRGRPRGTATTVIGLPKKRCKLQNSKMDVTVSSSTSFAACPTEDGVHTDARTSAQELIQEASPSIASQCLRTYKCLQGLNLRVDLAAPRLPSPNPSGKGMLEKAMEAHKTHHEHSTRFHCTRSKGRYSAGSSHRSKLHKLSQEYLSVRIVKYILYVHVPVACCCLN